MFAGLKLNMILAVDKKTHGVGYKNKLPWYCPDDLKFFKEKTLNSFCLVGMKTYKDLPTLYERMVIPITRDGRNGSYTIESVEDYLSLFAVENEEIFLIGGADLYKHFLSIGFIDKVYLSEIEFKNKEYEYDTFFDYPFDEFDKKEIQSVSTGSYNLKIYELTRKQGAPHVS